MRRKTSLLLLGTLVPAVCWLGGIHASEASGANVTDNSRSRFVRSHLETQGLVVGGDDRVRLAVERARELLQKAGLTADTAAPSDLPGQGQPLPSGLVKGWVGSSPPNLRIGHDGRN